MGLTLSVQKTSLQGVHLVEGEVFADERGRFSRVYCQQDLAKAGVEWAVRQTSLSENPTQHTLRGFHFQRKPYEEDKLVVCLAGEIHDIIVDLRPESPTFLKWEAFRLSGDKHQSLLVPKGCANAWMTMKPDTNVIYFMSEFFVDTHYAGIRYDDPFFKFTWPAKPALVSKKDCSYPDFDKKSYFQHG